MKSHLLKQNNNNETSPQASPRSTPKLSVDSTTTALEAVKNGRVEEPKPAQLQPPAQPSPALTQVLTRKLLTTQLPFSDHQWDSFMLCTERIYSVLITVFQFHCVNLSFPRRKKRAPTIHPQLLFLPQNQRTTPTTRQHLRLVFRLWTSVFLLKISWYFSFLSRGQLQLYFACCTENVVFRHFIMNLWQTWKQGGSGDKWIIRFISWLCLLNCYWQLKSN